MLEFPQFSPQGISPSSIQRKVGAFTLVELLAVIGIIVLLLSVIAPSVVGTMEATRLTSAGSELLLKISQARQIAMTENRPVEIRFYSDEIDGVKAVRAYQLFYHEASAAESKPVENAVDLAKSRVGAVAGELSPLISPQSWPHQTEKPVSVEPWKSNGATYLSVVMEPDGSTNIPLSLKESFITLCGERSLASSESPPPNYCTIQVDPVTGKATAYRP